MTENSKYTGSTEGVDKINITHTQSHFKYSLQVQESDRRKLERNDQVIKKLSVTDQKAETGREYVNNVNNMSSKKAIDELPQ